MHRHGGVGASSMTRFRLHTSFGLLLAASAVCFGGTVPSVAQGPKPFGIETPATTAYVVDAETGTVLFEKAPDERFQPASLAKIMTVDTVLDAMAKGEATAETSYPVSDHAWRTGGAPSRTATMFAAVRSSIPVEALLHGLMVQGANDAAIILGEGLAGTESAFALRMNQHAAELNLHDSRFVNATGLPMEGQYTTARDIGTLSVHLREAFPDWYKLYAEPEFEWNKVKQRNRNPLLRSDVGVTGLATGFAEGEGYSISSLMEGEGRKTVAVLGGFVSDAIRTKETLKILTWARDSFERRTLFARNVPAGHATVFGGLDTTVPLKLRHDLIAYVPKGRPDLVKAEVRYEAPLHAPVAQGDRIATLHVTIDGKPALEADLFADADVHAGTFSSRAVDAAQELAFGWIRGL